MKEAAQPYKDDTASLPRPIPAKRQEQRKYHTIRRLSFQAVSAEKEQRKDDPTVENILELLYDLPRERVHGQDSPFVRAARIKNENLERLTASMTEEQRDLLDACLDAGSRVEDMRDFDRFRFAFRFGAQLMAELITGRGDAL